MEENTKQNEYNYKNIILQIGIIIFSLVILIIVLITIASTVKSSNNLAFGKYKFYIMKAESKTDIVEKGDLVIVKKAKSDEIQIGDYIVYGDNEFYYCDNIVQTKKMNTIMKIIIAENDGIKYQFEESEIEGKVVYSIHKVGNIITFLRTPIGIIFFILFIICLFILLRMVFVFRNNNQIRTTDIHSIEEKNDK